MRQRQIVCVSVFVCVMDVMNEVSLYVMMYRILKYLHCYTAC